MEKYLYIRVSSKDQNLDRQLKDAEKLEIKQENIFADKQSGKDFNRPEYQKLISKLQEGDVVYFHSIDRMGRSYDDIIAEWQKITKDIKADIIILDMPLLDTTTKNNDLTGKFIADLVLQIMSYVAQKERENIRQRQYEGCQIAKAKGRFRKRDIDFDRFAELDKLVRDGKISVSTACSRLGVSSRATWYNLRKEVALKEA